jgi:hypothetical protein
MGTLSLKELAATGITITSTGASTTNGSATSAGAGSLDMRAGGTAGALEPIAGYFELTCQWATITNIVSGTIVADLYLVPSIDGTNYATVDTTASAGYISSANRFGSFTNPLASPSATTNYRFSSPIGDCWPTLYTPYIINRSGQTISVNWALKFFPVEGQY